MKRRVAIVLALLVLGAIVNVGVAWGCAVWSPESSSEYRTTAPWLLPVPEDWPNTANLRFQIGFGYSDIYAHANASDGSADRVVQWVFRAGLPLRSVQCARQRKEMYFAQYIFISLARPRGWREGIDIPAAIKSSNRSARYLPAIPIFPGFIINTLFYTVILWGLFAAPFVIRRALRRKRRLCEKCAYPIGTSPVCTECGAAITSTPSARGRDKGAGNNIARQ